MGQFTDTAKNTMLDQLEVAYTVYAALFNGDPSAAGTELTGGTPAYARQIVSLTAASGGQISVTTDETFDVPASSTFDYVGYFDASSGGNLLFYDDVTSETYGSQGTYILSSTTLSI